MKISYNGKTIRNKVGSNQYKTRSKKDIGAHLTLLASFMFFSAIANTYFNVNDFPPKANAQILSPLASPSASLAVEGKGLAEPALEVNTPELVQPTPTQLEEIVAYITRVFEPEGKDVVVRAINCFYSESGLREDAVGQNKDVHKSTDHGVAQLNSYWHRLTEEEKTDYKANIDRAYKIYKGRGDSFSAWYGKLCN